MLPSSWSCCVITTVTPELAVQVVFKIVPLEGSLAVNGETQKRSEEILAEVVIALTLSRLRDPTSMPPFVLCCVTLCAMLCVMLCHALRHSSHRAAHDYVLIKQDQNECGHTLCHVGSCYVQCFVSYVMPCFVSCCVSCCALLCFKHYVMLCVMLCRAACHAWLFSRKCSDSLRI